MIDVSLLTTVKDYCGVAPSVLLSNSCHEDTPFLDSILGEVELCFTSRGWLIAYVLAGG